MARCLIVGCGCRGRALAQELIERGHAVRGTTRSPEKVAAIEQAGAEAFVGDPDRVGTLAGALDQVGVVCLLLGSATGSPEALRALHGSRLEMLLARVLDAPVRAVLYEAAGTIPSAVLSQGAQIVRVACERSHIPYRLLDADTLADEAWAATAADAVERALLGG